MKTENMIFVFGSNLSGIHGAGAARFARIHMGAQMGKGEGLTGQSYALPTKGYNITFMPLEEVKTHVENFLKFALINPDLTFQVTQIGCGLAGFKAAEMAPLFDRAPSNCLFDHAWVPYLSAHHQYWGHI